MRYLMTILLVGITGCTTVEIQQYDPAIIGQIYVSEFTGPAGQIISNAIQIELQKQNLLADQEQTKFILTGNVHISGWAHDLYYICFELKDKNGNFYFRGNATSGASILLDAGKAIAKKIAKKLKIKVDNHLQPI